MPLYSIYEHTLETTIPLPFLGLDELVKPDFVFSISTSCERSNREQSWIFEWAQDGEPWLSHGITGRKHTLRFHDLADFDFELEKSEIICVPFPGTQIDTIVHLLLDQVIPRILGQRGNLVFHASAVATKEGAIAFIGPSGQGKSTLAASFFQRGFPLIADDSLLISEIKDTFWVVPSYPGFRLWDDTVKAVFRGKALRVSSVAEYSRKTRVNLEDGKSQFSSNRVPLKRVYILSPPEEQQLNKGNNTIKIDVIPPRQAFLEFYNHTFHTCPGGCNPALAREFERTGRIASLVPLYRLSHARNLALLPKVVEAVLTHCY